MNQNHEPSLEIAGQNKQPNRSTDQVRYAARRAIHQHIYGSVRPSRLDEGNLEPPDAAGSFQCQLLFTLCQLSFLFVKLVIFGEKSKACDSTCSNSFLTPCCSSVSYVLRCNFARKAKPECFAVLIYV